MTNRKHISDVLIESKSLKMMKGQAVSSHGMGQMIAEQKRPLFQNIAVNKGITSAIPEFGPMMSLIDAANIPVANAVDASQMLPSEKDSN